MVVQIDHYVVLGLASGAGLSKEEIKKAYQSKLLLVHDDPNEFLKLLHSYQVLKDPESRKLFDHHLRIQREREESSFVKEEDIIDVESISRITKEDDTTKRRRMMSRSAASSFVKKEEDIIDVESISKITKEEDDASKRRRLMISSFVKEEDVMDAGSISKIATKQEDKDSKILWDKTKAMDGILLVLWDLRKPFVDYYTTLRLYEIFGKFGSVGDVFIHDDNVRKYIREAKVAGVVMASKEAAIAAASYPYVLGHHSNPLHAFRHPGLGEDIKEALARFNKFLSSKGFIFVNSIDRFSY